MFVLYNKTHRAYSSYFQSLISKISMLEPSYIPPGAFGGGKPLPPPRVVNTDFYRGKVKSIYEREPLFQVIT